MSSGKYKKIKDIKIGDEVVCFNPENKIFEYTRVINHYNRITGKLVYKINLISGRIITATDDHKFITNNGWCEVKDFNKNTLLGIYTKSKKNNLNYSDSFIKILDNTDLINDDLTKKNIMPLYTNNDKILVIARLCGYYYVNELNFTNDIDKSQYIKDVKYIGFEKYDILDVNFVILMKKLCNDITWLTKCSDEIKREFLSSYLNLENKENVISNTFEHNIYEPNIIVEYLNQKQKANEHDYYFKYFINTDNKEILSYYLQYYSINYNYKLLNKLFVINEFYDYQKFKKNCNNYKIYRNYNNLSEWKKDVYVEGDVCFIPFNNKVLTKNKRISDITVESENHSFIGGNGFAVSNCAMGKQALGIYMSNFNNRIDTMGNILNYSQKPLVFTKLSKIYS